MPNRDRIPARLQIRIRTVCDMMLKSNHLDEAYWLWMAVGSPAACVSPGAQDALRRSAAISRQFGFPDVAQWVVKEALQPES